MIRRAVVEGTVWVAIPYSVYYRPMFSDMTESERADLTRKAERAVEVMLAEQVPGLMELELEIEVEFGHIGLSGPEAVFSFTARTPQKSEGGREG